MAPLIFDGAGTISGLQAGGLPDSSVTTADIANSAITAAKIGYAGAILQVVQTVKTDATTVQPGSTWTDIPTLSVSVTPASSSNKVLVSFNLHAITNMRGFVRIVRGSTAIAVGDAGGSRIQCTSGEMQWQESDTAELRNQSMTWLDSPSTTSSTTYKLQVRSDGGGDFIYINRAYTDTDAASRGRPVSVITVMEVAA